MEKCRQFKTIPFIPIRNSLSPVLFALQVYKREHFRAVRPCNHQLKTIQVIGILTAKMSQVHYFVESNKDLK
jgi:hypothetical protein